MNRPRSPGLVYAGVSLVLLLLIALVTLTNRQPPPPTIAEFAPQSVENISDAPSDQSSSSSGSRGGGGSGGGAAAGAATPAPIDVPRARRCVGDPPRQIEDPQSPPCVPYWAGDNGGATTRGVTRDEITIAMPMGYPSTDLERFFNTRFEFYGRQMKFKAIPGYAESCNPTGQQASAVSVDEQVGAFASGHSNSCGAIYYGEELARRKIIFANGAPEYYERDLVKFRPYLWQYVMDVDRHFENMAQWLCRGFMGRTARFAGDPLIAAEHRNLGIVSPRIAQSPRAADVRALHEGLRRCNAKVGFVNTDFQPGTDDSTIIAAMRDADVTTVVCLCEWVSVSSITKAATSQGFLPEWAFSTYRGALDGWENALFVDSAQIDHSFGLTSRPRQLSPDLEPHQQAARENGGAPQSALIYRSLLLLASGIQMAGPHLTPATFERALQRTVFPNPQTVHIAGAVGFGGAGAGNGPLDHSMTNDMAAWWWSSTHQAPNPSGKAGTNCYVEGGARHVLGDWPDGDDEYFKLPCVTGA